MKHPGRCHAVWRALRLPILVRLPLLSCGQEFRSSVDRFISVHGVSSQINDNVTIRLLIRFPFALLDILPRTLGEVAQHSTATFAILYGWRYWRACSRSCHCRALLSGRGGNRYRRCRFRRQSRARRLWFEKSHQRSLRWRLWHIVAAHKVGQRFRIA